MIFRNRILTSARSCIRNSWCNRERGRSKTNIRIPAGKCRSTPTGINSECFLLLKDPWIARAREHERSSLAEQFMLRLLWIPYLAGQKKRLILKSKILITFSSAHLKNLIFFDKKMEVSQQLLIIDWK